MIDAVFFKKKRNRGKLTLIKIGKVRRRSRFVNERSDRKYLKLQKMEFDRILLRKEYAHIESLIDEDILVFILIFLKQISSRILLIQ